MSRGKELRHIIEGVLLGNGATDIEFGYDGKTHQVATWKINGRTLKLHFSSTPSASKRSFENTRAQVRRACRAAKGPFVPGASAA